MPSPLFGGFRIAHSPLEQERTADNRDGAEGHGDAGHPWLQGDAQRRESPCSNRDTHNVVDDCPEEVETNPVDRALREVDGSHNINQVVLQTQVMCRSCDHAHQSHDR